MNSILSVYLDNWHDWSSTWDYLAKLQPAWVRIHQANARTIARVQEVCPSANLMLRSWEIDDNNGERKRELYANPVQAAHKHLAMWMDKIMEIATELNRNGWRYEQAKWYLGLVNEPDPNYLPQVVAYTREAMRVAGGHKLGVLVPSVGNFGKPGEPNSWELAKPLEAAIRDGGHILVVHEYWQPEGPSFVWTDEKGQQREDAGNLAWRHRNIPLAVPILIGESGANGYIYNRHTNQDNGGWQNYMDAGAYAAQVREYIEGCDSRVQGVCLFMTDYHSDQWRTFDTTPAHDALLAIKGVRPQPAPSQPSTVYAPVVGAPPAPKPPSGPAAPPALHPQTGGSMGTINPLALEAILAVESGHNAFGPDGRLLIRFEAHIFKTYLGDDALWARHFRHGSPVWTGQEMNPDGVGPWFAIHTGAQSSEYAAFELAKRLNPRAAHLAISMGAPQIMGFNHARIGYATPEAMYSRFSKSWYAQVIGLLNFVLGDPALAAALNALDWRSVARIYNGPSNIGYAAPRYEAAYRRLAGG